MKHMYYLNNQNSSISHSGLDPESSAFKRVTHLDTPGLKPAGAGLSSPA